MKSVCFAILATLSLLSLHAIAAEQAAVKLEDLDKTVVLSNGIVSATIDKAGARITSYKFRGLDMLTAGYYSMDGGKDYRNPANCIYTVKQNTPDIVDIGMRRVWKDEPQAFDIDVHYVLRRGDSGIYTYASLEHPANYPATRVGEWRMVWKLNGDLLEKIFVDDQRQWVMPTSEDKKSSEATSIPEIRKYTTGLWAGKFECKYDYNVEYYKLGTWGHASDKNKVGAFIVLGGYDFFNDGPTHPDLSAADSINHIHFGRNHFGGTGTEVAANESWSKMYGPFLLYCNYNESGSSALWADAQARVKTEESNWPYAWLTDNPLYPSKSQRGSVRGKLTINDSLRKGVSSANAWVGVAQTDPDKNWQNDSRHYQYWTRADANGNFTIPHIRPGAYTLYAFVDGAVGEYEQANVVVSAAKATDLSNITWNVPHHGTRLAWEIGYPDRTAREFRHGDDYFQGFLWTKISTEFPNPLDFTIGKSEPWRDWNWVQTHYTVDKIDPKISDQSMAPAWNNGRVGYEEKLPHVAHQWRIHFDLAEAPTKPATLTLAIASAQRATILVNVNDQSKPTAKVVPTNQGGNAMLRHGIHAKYSLEYVTIPPEQLKVGSNVISLQLESVRTPDAHVMYDYINLELP